MSADKTVSDDSDHASETFEPYDTIDMQVASHDNPPALMEVSDNEDRDDEDEEADEEVADMVAELEKSWEPLREGAPVQEAENEDIRPRDTEIPLDEENDDDEGYTRRSADRFIIGDGYGVKPVVSIRYNDRHPSARAGQPLTREESKDYEYGAALGRGNNPWVPFNSEKDWKIARWAKLRGVGSTAFSELLAIDGVHFYLSKFTLFKCSAHAIYSIGL